MAFDTSFNFGANAVRKPAAAKKKRPTQKYIKGKNGKTRPNHYAAAQGS
jgi:hypothetical protein